MYKTFSIILLFCAACLFNADVLAQQKHTSPGIIAHRGAWKNTGAPQNSIASLKAAIQLKCDGSEFDVWMTRDSIPVVNHDANFLGMPIEAHSYAELLYLRHPNGESLPTLEAYLNAGKGQKKTRLILEIKTSQKGREHTLELTRKCVETVHRIGLRKMVDYIAFDYAACKTVKQIDSKAAVAYLNGDKSPQQLQEDKLDGLDYHFSILKNNAGWINDAHRRKLFVNVWTVNDETTAKWLAGQRVDFITTDEPELLQHIISPARTL